MEDPIFSIGERIRHLAIKISEEFQDIDLRSSWHNFSFDFHFDEDYALSVKDIRLVKSD